MTLSTPPPPRARYDALRVRSRALLWYEFRRGTLEGITTAPAVLARASVASAEDVFGTGTSFANGRAAWSYADANDDGRYGGLLVDGDVVYGPLISRAIALSARCDIVPATVASGERIWHIGKADDSNARAFLRFGSSGSLVLEAYNGSGGSTTATVSAGAVAGDHLRILAVIEVEEGSPDQMRAILRVSVNGAEAESDSGSQEDAPTEWSKEGGATDTRYWIGSRNGSNANEAIHIRHRVDPGALGPEALPALPPEVVDAWTSTDGTTIYVQFSRPMGDPTGKEGQFTFRRDGGSPEGFSSASYG